MNQLYLINMLHLKIDTKDTHKPRATKRCDICDMEMLSSSHSKHIKSKAHLKKL